MKTNAVWRYTGCEGERDGGVEGSSRRQVEHSKSTN